MRRTHARRPSWLREEVSQSGTERATAIVPQLFGRFLEAFEIARLKVALGYMLVVDFDHRIRRRSFIISCQRARTGRSSRHLKVSPHSAYRRSPLRLIHSSTVVAKRLWPWRCGAHDLPLSRICDGRRSRELRHQCAECDNLASGLVH
jgi:hypothetical protein